jgi:hypothetical protein
MPKRSLSSLSSLAAPSTSVKQRMLGVGASVFLALGLTGCGVGVGLGGYLGGYSDPVLHDIRESNAGDVAAVATDTLLALGGPVRSLIDANLPPVAQRPRQGLIPNVLDLTEQWMPVRAPVTGSNGAGQQVMSAVLACSSGSGSVRSEFVNAALISVGDTLTVTTQDCVMNGQRYSGSLFWRALAAGTGMPGVSSAWNGRWSLSMSGWSQYDFIAPPIGLRAEGNVEFQALRRAAGDAEAKLTTLQSGGQVYGMNLSLFEGTKLVSNRDLAGVAGWREQGSSGFTSLDLTLAESFQVSNGLASIQVRTSAESISAGGALPSGTWYAVGPDNSVVYVVANPAGALLVQYASSFGGALSGSFNLTWAELRRYL